MPTQNLAPQTPIPTTQGNRGLRYRILPLSSFDIAKC